MIAVGVGVALAGDALWEGHQERIQEGEYIARLRDDLVATDSLLQAAMNSEVSFGRAARRVAGALNTPVLPPGDSLRILTQRALGISGFAPLMGTVESLVRSGDLGLISDPLLRAAISEYDASVTRFTERYEALAQLSFELVNLSINRKVNRLALSGDVESTRLPLDWANLARDPVFVGDLTSLANLSSARQFYLGRIGNLITALDAMLRPS